MAHKIAPYRERITRTVGADGETIYSQPVPDGARLFVQTIAFRNQTRANSDLQISVAQRGYLHVLEMIENAASNRFEVVHSENWLWERERLALTLNNVVASDVCDVHVTGNIRWDGSVP